MAQIAKIEAEAHIKSSSEKVYGFFKNNLNKLAEIFPQRIKSVELIEGEEGCAGSVKLVKYELGMQMTAKVKIEAVDDEEKSINFDVFEGEIMQLYKSFKAKVTACEGSVKWSIEFEKATDSAPVPDIYAAVAVEISKVVDTYLLNH